MATVTGVIQGWVLASGNPAGTTATRQVWNFTANAGTYAGSGDTGAINGLGAALASETRSGKTYTLVDCLNGFPGLDNNNVLVYTNSPTISGDNITFNYTNSAGTTLATTSTSTVGIGFFASFDVT